MNDGSAPMQTRTDGSNGTTDDSRHVLVAALLQIAQDDDIPITVRHFP